MPSYYEGIYGWFDWPDLYKGMVEKYKDGGNFIEIGCYKGRSGMYLAELIIEENANIHVDYIDPWEWNNPHVEVDRDRTPESIYQEFLHHFNNVAKGDWRFRIIRNRSQLEAANYLDQSLNFVYVDGGHEPEEVVNDVQLFLPKVKSGGVLAGHDVNGEDVRQGLDILSQSGFVWYTVSPNSWRHDVN